DRHLGSMLANDSAPSVMELADHRDVLLSDPGNPGLVSVKEEVARSSVVVIASPTYKGTYTGILKLFLEQFPGGSGLEGVLVVPMMMCGSAAHAMAAEVFLKPLLAELGATCPTGAVVLPEDENGWGAHLS